MKLRDRQKRVSSDIKQEDYKFDPTSINLSFSTVNESSTCNLDIKQEDTKNYSSLLKQNDLKKEKTITTAVIGAMRECQISNQCYNIASQFTMSSRVGLQWSKISTRSLIYMIPISIASRTIPSHKIPRNSIVPDPDDPNRHCRACNRTFANKSTYKQHCRYTHGMASVKFSNYSLALDGISDTYCKLCDVRLSNKTSYKRHLITMHKIDWRLNHQRPKSIVTDVNDPNFYCRSCEKTLPNKHSFRNHLVIVHAIYQPTTKKSSLEPDTNDPNNYCRACKKDYSSKSTYRIHLRKVHQIALPPLKGNVNNDKLPNSSDPHHYCSVCKKSFMSRLKYRSHCKQVHYMVLDHCSISNPNATIDINHTKFYCAQCEHSYYSKSVFRKHLKDVHNI